MKKKVLAVLMSAVMVGSLMAAPVFAAENLSDTTEGVAQFEGLTANEAYDFQIVVKSFQSTYWQAALQGMDAAARKQSFSDRSHLFRRLLADGSLRFTAGSDLTASADDERSW
jgi:ABC-type sugar transport system substrate-binding protein